MVRVKGFGSKRGTKKSERTIDNGSVATLFPSPFSLSPLPPLCITVSLLCPGGQSIWIDEISLFSSSIAQILVPLQTLGANCYNSVRFGRQILLSGLLQILYCEGANFAGVVESGFEIAHHGIKIPV